MKLKNVLIVVKDIERSKKFYQDLFGLEMVLDNDGNMILTEGLVLQEGYCRKKNTGKRSLGEISFLRTMPANYILRNLILKALSKGLKSIIRK